MAAEVASRGTSLPGVSWPRQRSHQLLVPSPYPAFPPVAVCQQTAGPSTQLAQSTPVSPSAALGAAFCYRSRGSPLRKPERQQISVARIRSELARPVGKPVATPARDLGAPQHGGQLRCAARAESGLTGLPPKDPRQPAAGPAAAALRSSTGTCCFLCSEKPGRCHWQDL